MIQMLKFWFVDIPREAKVLVVVVLILCHEERKEAEVVVCEVEVAFARPLAFTRDESSSSSRV